MKIRAVLATGLFALALPAVAGDAEDIRARSDAFEAAYNGGDAAGVAALYTEDALVMPPGGGFVNGREETATMWQGAMDSGFGDLALTTKELEPAGDMLIEVGTFTGVAGDAPANGKYIVVWKKVDGEWYLHRDIWNDAPAE